MPSRLRPTCHAAASDLRVPLVWEHGSLNVVSRKPTCLPASNPIASQPCAIEQSTEWSCKSTSSLEVGPGSGPLGPCHTSDLWPGPVIRVSGSCGLKFKALCPLTDRRAQHSLQVAVALRPHTRKHEPFGISSGMGVA